MSESKVFLADNDDPEMQRAYEKAWGTFRYFWREIAWERRRIVPALDLAYVKVPFSDGDRTAPAEERPSVEHMWIDQVDFDGRQVTGVLINSPNWLQTVKEGDTARVALGEISDWMYASSVASGTRTDRPAVYGAYTVNLLRARMSRRERREHDDAWGLDFGDPANIRVVPYQKKPGGILSWFGKRESETEIPEHPMSAAAAAPLRDQIAKDRSMLTARDDNGWTYLHQQALAGSAATVKVLLDGGVDRDAVTNHGMTALQLAQSLGWDKVAALLATR